MHDYTGFSAATVAKAIIGYGITPHEPKSRAFTINGIDSVPFI
jgi:hypothetical protein